MRISVAKWSALITLPVWILLNHTENWRYIHTECAHGWWPHNGFCYRLLPKAEAGSWEESSRACSSEGADLASLHSLSEVEMLLKLMANCKEKQAETGTFWEKLPEMLECDTMHYVCKSYGIYRFQAGHGSMDWSLETGVGADCAVVGRLPSYSHTLAPVSAPPQPNRHSTVRQIRESGRKCYKCLIYIFFLFNFFFIERNVERKKNIEHCLCKAYISFQNYQIV